MKSIIVGTANGSEQHKRSYQESVETNLELTDTTELQRSWVKPRWASHSQRFHHRAPVVSVGCCENVVCGVWSVKNKNKNIKEIKGELKE